MDLRSWWFVLCVVIPCIRGTWSPSYTATWQLLGPHNETCLLLTAHFEFTIPYLQTNGEFGIAKVQVPTDGKETGSCMKWQQEMEISWPVDPVNDLFEKGSFNSVVFSFSQNGTKGNSLVMGFFQLVKVMAILHTNPNEFPEAAISNRVFRLRTTGLRRWTAPVDYSYFCDSEEQIPLDLHETVLTVLHIQVQPFHETPLEGNPTDFSFRSYCSADVESMMINGLLFITLLFLVSISIGCCLHFQKRAPYRPL